MARIIYNEKDFGMRDYPRGHWEGALSITKVRNALKKEGLEVVNGQNNSVNGVREGCSGFAKHPDGRLVYFHSDASFGGYAQCYYRTAKHDRDYTGGSNHNCSNAELIKGIKTLFGCSPKMWE